MPISLDRPSAVKRGSGRPSLVSASGVIISGFALIPPRGVNHSGFRSGRVLIDRFPASFPRTDNHEPPQLGKSRVLSHHGSTMTSSSGCRSPGRPESLGFGCEIMYTAPLRLTGRSPAMAHVFETPGRTNGVPWRLPRCCSTIWRSNGLRATSRTFYTRIPFSEGKRNQQPHQPEKLKLKDNAKMGNGSGLNKGTPNKYFSPIDRSFRVPSNVR